MKKLLLFLLCLGTFAWGETGADDANAPALTIYNQNFFIAREHLPLDLHTGINQIAYAGVAAHLEPDSVILRDPNGRALQILEQSYRNDPISQELLLSFYEGKTIDFVVGQTPDGKPLLTRGKVIRSGYPHSRLSRSMACCGLGFPDSRCSHRLAAIPFSSRL